MPLISLEHGNNIKALAKYYSQIEKELKKSGKYRFIKREHNLIKEQPA